MTSRSEATPRLYCTSAGDCREIPRSRGDAVSVKSTALDDGDFDLEMQYGGANGRSLFAFKGHVYVTTVLQTRRKYHSAVALYESVVRKMLYEFAFAWIDDFSDYVKGAST